MVLPSRSHAHNPQTQVISLPCKTRPSIIDTPNVTQLLGHPDARSGVIKRVSASELEAGFRRYNGMHGLVFF